MKLQFLYIGNVKFIMKEINNFLMYKKHLFTIILPILYLSCMLSHNSHVLLYLNGLNTCIEHLYMF